MISSRLLCWSLETLSAVLWCLMLPIGLKLFCQMAPVLFQALLFVRHQALNYSPLKSLHVFVWPITKNLPTWCCGKRPVWMAYALKRTTLFHSWSERVRGNTQLLPVLTPTSLDRTIKNRGCVVGVARTMQLLFIVILPCHTLVHWCSLFCSISKNRTYSSVKFGIWFSDNKTLKRWKPSCILPCVLQSETVTHFRPPPTLFSGNIVVLLPLCPEANHRTGLHRWGWMQFYWRMKHKQRREL